jgi:amino acid transporter
MNGAGPGTAFLQPVGREGHSGGRGWARWRAGVGGTVTWKDTIGGQRLGLHSAAREDIAGMSGAANGNPGRPACGCLASGGRHGRPRSTLPGAFAQFWVVAEHPAPTPDDEELLRRLGYRQELARRLSGFSNFAISFSIICILAGGITSFHVGLAGGGGAAMGLGWPLVCLFSLVVALTMAQVASAFPTAGGLYHWGSLLGGRGCGWATAWFNLAGLVTVLAAVNSGAVDFALAVTGWGPEGGLGTAGRTTLIVGLTLLQAGLNHYGTRWTTRLTDLSGWLILIVAAVLTVALFVAMPAPDWSRLWTLVNLSGRPAAAPVLPRHESLPWVFCLGFLLPAYTITGFDASAHTAEETVGAARTVPRSLVRAVWISGLAGWVMVVALVLALPDLPAAVDRGAEVVPWLLRTLLPAPLAQGLLGGIIAAQFLCGLAALTSASRMTYAFARDGGLPGSAILSRVSPRSQSPAAAVWCTALAGVGFTVLVPYATIAAICVVLLYVSYVLPVAAGGLAYGRTWTRMGPWNLGVWFRPLALVAVLGCGFLLVIGCQPPNDLAVPVLGGVIAVMLVVWFGWERRRFKGPARGALDLH